MPGIVHMYDIETNCITCLQFICRLIYQPNDVMMSLFGVMYFFCEINAMLKFMKKKSLLLSNSK